MKMLGLLVLLCLTCHLLYAGDLRNPPPLATEPVAERNYLSEIARNHNNLVHVTSSPNGSRNGVPGDIIWATYGGNDRLCVNAGSGPGLNTTWKCVTVS